MIIHPIHKEERAGAPGMNWGDARRWESREEAAEHPEEAACEGGSADLAAAEGSSAAAGDGADSQALERLESAGEAACCLNDTFEVCLHTRRCPLQPCLTLLVQDEEGLPAALSREEGLPHAHLDLLLLWRPCRNIPPQIWHARRHVALGRPAGQMASLSWSVVSPQKEQLEAAALQEEMDQNEADHGSHSQNPQLTLCAAGTPWASPVTSSCLPSQSLCLLQVVHA